MKFTLLSVITQKTSFLQIFNFFSDPDRDPICPVIANPNPDQTSKFFLNRVGIKVQILSQNLQNKF